MIGTDEMSSTGMDISESFRPEDLSKTDFFDFVTATEMGIGVGIGSVGGVGVSLQAQHHQYQQQQHQQQQQQQQQQHQRLTANSNMTHDGGGGTPTGRNVNDGNSNNSINNGNTSDPTLQGYEFWHTDKDNNRLDSSIFEDLDRYCWQQQQQLQQQQQQPPQTTNVTQSHHTPANTTHNNAGLGSTNSVLNCDSTATSNAATRIASHTNSNIATSSSISQNNSSPNNTTTIHNTDGQIYTITVLNGGNETATSTPTTPSWLKREPEDTQIPATLDLDSLLGNFSGYIKSEYPYDDSGFSTDGTKDVINGDANGISIQQQQHQHQQQQQDIAALHSMASIGVGSGDGGGSGSGGGGGQTLPSLVTAMSSGRAGINIGQQLVAQFQNNNNDWHMIDHNAEQNSAESLLRSALQGKGYTKGLHHMHNGSIALLPTSPTVKDEEMRRILFCNDADSLAFADSTLNTAQIFEESQHHTHMLQQLHNNTTPNGPMSQSSHGNNNTSLMVEDMFLTLENAFNDDFDKMKRIANEVQQYCHTPPMESDFMSNDIMMQISPTPATTTTATTTTQLQPLHSPVTTTPTTIGISGLVPAQQQPTSPLTTANTTLQLQHPHQHHQQQRPHKPEVTRASTTTPAGSVTMPTTTTNNRISTTTKATKKYKRTSSATSNNNNNNSNNNNNLNVLNHNNNNSNSISNNNNNNNNASTKNSNNNGNGNGNGNTNANTNTGSSNNSTTSSGGSSSSSSNSPPTAHCNGQRKERSLHYCSICSKGFKDKYSVNVHIRTHTGEKPFACSLCGKSFRQKAHLAKHYQTHIAQKNNHGSGIVKGNSSKHHRNAANTATVQQRQINMLASVPIPTTIGGNPTTGGVGGNGLGVSGINPGLLGVTSTVVTLNGPTSSGPPGMTTNVLPPPNGLLANR